MYLASLCRFLSPEDKDDPRGFYPLSLLLLSRYLLLPLSPLLLPPPSSSMSNVGMVCISTVPN